MGGTRRCRDFQGHQGTMKHHCCHTHTHKQHPHKHKHTHTHTRARTVSQGKWSNVSASRKECSFCNENPAILEISISFSCKHCKAPAFAALRKSAQTTFVGGFFPNNHKGLALCCVLKRIQCIIRLWNEHHRAKGQRQTLRQG